MRTKSWVRSLLFGGLQVYVACNMVPRQALAKSSTVSRACFVCRRSNSHRHICVQSSLAFWEFWEFWEFLKVSTQRMIKKYCFWEFWQFWEFLRVVLEVLFKGILKVWKLWNIFIVLYCQRVVRVMRVIEYRHEQFPCVRFFQSWQFCDLLWLGWSPGSEFQAKKEPLVISSAEEDEVPVKAKKVIKKPAAYGSKTNSDKAGNSSGSYVPGEYAELRQKYIQGEREKGASFAEAKKKWDESFQKRKLLAPLSLGELVKRRFVPKGTKSNPWASWLVVSTPCAYTAVGFGKKQVHSELDTGLWESWKRASSFFVLFPIEFDHCKLTWFMASRIPLLLPFQIDFWIPDWISSVLIEINYC